MTKTSELPSAPVPLAVQVSVPVIWNDGACRGGIGIVGELHATTPPRVRAAQASAIFHQAPTVCVANPSEATRGAKRRAEGSCSDTTRIHIVWEQPPGRIPRMQFWALTSARVKFVAGRANCVVT